jgi:hypothetical protein
MTRELKLEGIDKYKNRKLKWQGETSLRTIQKRTHLRNKKESLQETKPPLGEE